MRYEQRNMPKCFSSVEDWRDWNRLAKVSDFRGNYCTDCLPWFKFKMITLGKCKYPKTVFKHIQHDDCVEIVGVRK